MRKIALLLLASLIIITGCSGLNLSEAGDGEAAEKEEPKVVLPEVGDDELVMIEDGKTVIEPAELKQSELGFSLKLLKGYSFVKEIPQRSDVYYKLYLKPQISRKEPEYIATISRYREISSYDWPIIHDVDRYRRGSTDKVHFLDVTDYPTLSPENTHYYFYMTVRDWETDEFTEDVHLLRKDLQGTLYEIKLRTPKDAKPEVVNRLLSMIGSMAGENGSKQPSFPIVRSGEPVEGGNNTFTYTLPFGLTEERGNVKYRDYDSELMIKYLGEIRNENIEERVQAYMVEREEIFGDKYDLLPVAEIKDEYFKKDAYYYRYIHETFFKDVIFKKIQGHWFVFDYMNNFVFDWDLEEKFHGVIKSINLINNGKDRTFENDSFKVTLPPAIVYEPSEYDDTYHRLNYGINNGGFLTIRDYGIIRREQLEEMIQDILEDSTNIVLEENNLSFEKYNPPQLNSGETYSYVARDIENKENKFETHLTFKLYGNHLIKIEGSFGLHSIYQFQSADEPPIEEYYNIINSLEWK